MKDFMVRKREAKGLTLQQMARICECSEGLLRLLEESSRDITHPHIASRIAKGYGLTVDEYNRIIHAKYKASKLPKPVAPPANENVDKVWRQGWGTKEGGTKE